ncbi:zinc-dependent metalloprotease [Rarobacter incanus]|uniref:Putative hydrolase n=1 Tax=Rarobacter incanus TaxID=153494 RepID=A0A542SPJ1_9MICO|nr:zinc-dependent metalloprotease [Rarobacter incanus]TQK76177.1 putative hydrolase [Rarobacter incanus]
MNPTPDPSDPLKAWEQALRAAFGPNADAIIEQMRASGVDMAELMRQSEALQANPQMLDMIMRQAATFLAADPHDPVNAPLAKNIARQVTSSLGPDPSMTDADQRAVRNIFSACELWLDVATTLPPATVSAHAWSRAEWVEATISTWESLTSPVAGAVASALTQLFRDEAIADATIDPAGGFAPDSVLRSMASAAFGMQVGQATGELAAEVFGTTDVGIPLVDTQTVAMVIKNVDEFAAGLDSPRDEVRHFLAVREATAARLFASVPWLRAHVRALVDEYARGVVIDREALEETLRDVDPSNIEAIRQAMSGGIFAVPTTSDQKATLARLETVLALIEGWVDTVSTQAAIPHLRSVVSLREMMRRRRAAGGPAEQTFAKLVGLELRPRRAREAAALWELLHARCGVDGRDQVWDHPDFLPEGTDLDDPHAFVERWSNGPTASTDDVDAALSAIFAEADRDDGQSQD